jgi:hypothetical protein
MKPIIEQDEIHKLLSMLSIGLVDHERYLGRSNITEAIRDWYSKNAPEYFSPNQTTTSSNSN